MGIHTIKSIIEKRKLKWLFKSITEPEDNVMLRAALTGHMELDINNTTIITPWMEEMAGIITKLYVRN